MYLSGAQRRVGYINTGGAYFVTQRVPWDEELSWVEQNRLAVGEALAGQRTATRWSVSSSVDSDDARHLLLSHGAPAARPWVGVHASGGRTIKEWPVERWIEVSQFLQREFAATIVLTGSPTDRRLAERFVGQLSSPPVDLCGRLSVTQTLAVISVLDLFLSADTGPMHMACAVATPSVAVFGPSDPGRYFSGGSGVSGARHVVARSALWCSPCNLIRMPPAECLAALPPECLRDVSVSAVCSEAARLLRETGGFRAHAAGLMGAATTKGL
jgi:ADP-heptose:LPS heptosyltransferase